MKKRSSRKVNKSEAIRQYKGEHADARPKEIVEALAAQGIAVNAQTVSTTLYNMKKTGGAPAKSGRGSKSAGRRGADLPISHLHEAKRLVDSVGSIEKAKAALELLAQLR